MLSDEWRSVFKRLPALCRQESVSTSILPDMSKDLSEMQHLIVWNCRHHGRGFALSQQVVQHEIRAAFVYPVVGQIAAAAHKIERGIGLLAVIVGGA